MRSSAVMWLEPWSVPDFLHCPDLAKIAVPPRTWLSDPARSSREENDESRLRSRAEGPTDHALCPANRPRVAPPERSCLSRLFRERHAEALPAGPGPVIPTR